MATSDTDPPELVKTVPISRHRAAEPRTVLTLDPGDLGDVQVGDLVEGLAEVEVSVTCLEQLPQCVGTRYSYSPHVAVRFYLARSRTPGAGEPIGPWRGIVCSQERPNRNHHCVLNDHAKQVIAEAADRPCPAGGCHLNLAITAYHRGARRGNVVVVGADGDSGIQQDKARLGAAVYRPGDEAQFPPLANPLETSSRNVRRIPVTANASGGENAKRVAYSLPLGRVHAGEQFTVFGHATIGISGVPYETLLQSQLILGETPTSTDRSGLPFKITTAQGRVSEENGSNCTHGPSYFSDPCSIRKLGVLVVTLNSRTNPQRDTGPWKRLFLNFVVDAVAEDGGPFHSGDHVRVRRDGFLRAFRFGPEYAR
jgi:hypothetical protein